VVPLLPRRSRHAAAFIIIRFPSMRMVVRRHRRIIGISRQ
jgi:hypothetical protein